MKISKSKQELASIISENGGWRDGAEWAWYGNLTKTGWFGISKPWYSPKKKSLLIRTADLAGEFPSGKVANWHQTILSRAEYLHLYPAPDADGWIEWNGGECPVDGDSVIDVKLSDGDEFFGVDADWDWHQGSGCDIIAYRQHKPEQAKPEFCESVTRAIPEPDGQVWTSPPSIEQLAADYRNAKDYAQRKQQEADDAKADAEAKLAELVAAGKAIGLVLGIAEPELVITDWRDLQVGDEVDENYRGIERVVGSVLKIDVGDSNQPIFVSDGVKSVWATEFRFIRRP